MNFELKIVKLEVKVKADPDFIRVRNYVLDTRKKKLNRNYNFTMKNGGQLKRLIRVFTPEEVMAAWDVFIGDLMDDPDRFWRKGYTIDNFCHNQCFSVCQEYSRYKEFIRRHEPRGEGIRFTGQHS